MATPAAILSILVDTQTGKSSVALAKYQKQLETTNLHGQSLEKQSAKTGKAISSLSAPAEKTTHSLVGLAKGLLAVGGAFVAFEKAKQAIESTVELGHATERLSAVTGLDAKQASTWIETMKVRNVQTKQVALSFITLSRNIRNAESGSKTAKTAFEQLGISTKSLATKSTQETLLEVADGLSKIKQPAERAAIAQQLFGRAAQGLIPVLVEGRKGVEDALAATEKYGAFLPKNVKGINGAIEAQRQLTLASDGLKIAFTTAVLPSLVKVSSAVLGFVAQMRTGQGVGGQFAAIIGAAFQKVKDAVGVVVPIVAGLIAQFKAGDPAIRAMAAGIAGLVVALKAASVAQAALNVISEASPWVRAATLIAALVTALLVLQEKNKGVHDALENTWTSIRNFAQAVFPTIRDIAVRAFTIIVGTVHTLRDVFNAVFPVMRTIAVASFTIIKIQVDLLVAAFQVAFDIIKPLVVNAFKAIQFAVENVGIPAFRALSGPLHTLGDIFSTIWGGIKGAVKTAMDFILGAFGTFLGVVADVANVKLPFLGKVFGNAGKNIQAAADNVNNLKDQLDGLPAKKSTEVSVNVNFLSNLPGAISSIGATISNIGAKVGGANPVLGHRAVGGMVDRPMIMVGEEAPKHPEVVLATNPAYRQRNLGLFAQAGKMLGVPGFAQGGIATAGKTVSQIDPWTAQHAGSWMKGKAGSWANQFAPAAGGPGGPGGPVPAGTVRDWLTKALQITNHFSPGNLSALYGRTIQESGGRPGAINLWDSNAKAGHPSKGLLQTIDSTFNQYALPGLGNIWNPIANAVAAIRYMFARYGHIVGPSSSGYAKGGILGKIQGFAQGGIPGHPELHGNVSQIGEMVLSQFPGLSVTSTTGGTHASGSYHYKGDAVDLASSSYPLMNSAASWVLSSGLYKRLVEGIHNPNLSVASGATVSPSHWGATTWAQHLNHIHLAAIGDAVAATLTSGASSVAKATSKFIPSKIPKLKLPFKAPSGLPFSAPEITGLFGQMSGILDPASGGVATLSDLISSSSAINDQRNSEYATAHPGLDTSTGLIASSSGGKSIADNAFVQQRIVQLQQLLEWQAQIRIKLENALALINQLVTKIQIAVAKREAIVEKIRSKIRGNLAAIQGFSHSGGTRRQKSDAAAEITALKRQNTTLGGDALKVGTGGEIGSYLGQISTLRDRMSTVTDDKLAIIGASGIGGTLGQAKIDERNIEDQLRVFAPSSVTTALAAANAAAGAGAGSAAAAGPSDTSALLQQIATNTALTKAVYDIQGNVFAGLDFAGSFGGGGLVPGPTGAPMAAIVHGGEYVSPAGGSHVRVIMEDHRTRVFVNDVEQAIEQAGRRTSRTASRRLPGSTGR